MLVALLFKLVVIVLIAGAGFAAGYAVALRRRTRATPRELEVAPPVEAAPSLLEPARVVFTPDPVQGTAEWQRAMVDVGERMRAAGVRLVLFAHGSFVGDDPLAIAQVVEDSLPVLPELGRALRGFTRAQISRVLGDLSNFPRDYVDGFARATGVSATDFVWSGENHHAARIQGAVRLARALALHGGGTLRPGDRVLLVGHSHGGQLFAILSQLLARTRGYEELLAAAQARGEDMGALEDHLALLRRCAIDVATFGTPPRYGWARGAGFRLLHVVNHRGAAPRASSLLGFFHTRTGDYVHQLGGHGSDFPALTAAERSANGRLDAVLGQGSSFRAWVRQLSTGLRVPPEGQTVLVDYGDAATLVPNFWATGFGHAAYTRRDAMLFHARLVASELYPSTAPRLVQPPLLGEPRLGDPAQAPDLKRSRGSSFRALARLVR
jgi:hypothetical protein